MDQTRRARMVEPQAREEPRDAGDAVSAGREQRRHAVRRHPAEREDREARHPRTGHPEPGDPDGGTGVAGFGARREDRREGAQLEACGGRGPYACGVMAASGVKAPVRSRWRVGRIGAVGQMQAHAGPLRCGPVRGADRTHKDLQRRVRGGREHGLQGLGFFDEPHKQGGHTERCELGKLTQPWAGTRGADGEDAGNHGPRYRAGLARGGVWLGAAPVLFLPWSGWPIHAWGAGHL